LSNRTNTSKPGAAADDTNARPQQAAPESALQDIGLHEKIIAIDPADDSTYPIDKLEAHLHNVPHVAISIFLFNDNHLHARVGELYENEYVHCFFGTLANRQLADQFNPVEVAAIEWLTVPQIIKKIETEPNRFTEWFKIYMSTHRNMINDVIC